MSMKCKSGEEDLCVSSPIHRRENSNAIQVHSPVLSVWRGKTWSNFVVQIKVVSSFLPMKSSTDADSNDRQFMLSASLRHASTGKSYAARRCDRLRMGFGPNYFQNKDQIPVGDDPYKTLFVSVHRDLFLSGERFVVTVEARNDKSSLDDEIVFGQSQEITVTDYALSIEQHFLKNPHVSRLNDNEYSWYSKCGGELSSLEVQIHLRNANGRVVANPLKTAMPLTTALVYTDGTPAPLMPLSPPKILGHISGDHSLSERNEPLLLYRPMERSPIQLQPKESSCTLRFRIEEVSFHHPGHSGFKVKVWPTEPAAQNLVHPGVLEENIIVLSKPKHFGKNKNIATATTSPKPLKKRHKALQGRFRKATMPPAIVPPTVSGRVGGDTTDCRREIEKKLVSVSRSSLVDVFRSHGRCIVCHGLSMGLDDFLRPQTHTLQCPLRAVFLSSPISSAERKPCSSHDNNSESTATFSFTDGNLPHRNCDKLHPKGRNNNPGEWLKYGVRSHVIDSVAESNGVIEPLPSYEPNGFALNSNGAEIFPPDGVDRMETVAQRIFRSGQHIWRLDASPTFITHQHRLIEGSTRDTEHLSGRFQEESAFLDDSVPLDSTLSASLSSIGGDSDDKIDGENLLPVSHQSETNLDASRLCTLFFDTLGGSSSTADL